MGDRSTPRISKAIALSLATLLVAVTAVSAIDLDPAEASHKPANKAAASGSSLEVMTDYVTDSSDSQVHEILSTSLRTSTTQDLLFEVTAECALWTDVTTVGNDENRAVAQVKVWVEFDGTPVPVAHDGPGDGEVVFCNRDYRVETLQFDDEDATIKRFLSTRQANAFNWFLADVGSGIHEVSVMAQLDANATQEANAKAAIGQRTLVIEPIQLANDA